VNKLFSNFSKRNFILLLVAVASIETLTFSLLSTQKASAALNESQLRNKAAYILKLEAMTRCVQEQLNTDGIKRGSGPFNEQVVSVGTIEVRVGHLVQQDDGKWNCVDGASRDDAWFKLLLRNGSPDQTYGGWNKEPYAYTNPLAYNVRDIDGDGTLVGNSDLYFINRSNKANPDSNEQNKALTGATGGPAKGKVIDQINATKKWQEKNLSPDEKKAMAYLNLSEAFFKGCGAKKVTNPYSVNSDTATIGGTTYTVNDDNALISVGYGEYGTTDGTGDLSCRNIGNKMGTLFETYSKVTGNKDQLPPSTAQSGTGTADAGEDQSCEGRAGVIGWFGCPIIETLGTATNWIDKQIQNLMVIQPGLYKENPGLYSAWTGFRNIALSLLVAAMLVIVISTALDLGFLDAYTVKKAFPRLIVSIVFILLSWWICTFLIDFTNTLGQGILGIMEAPFNLNESDNLGDLFVVGGSDSAAQTAILGTAVFAAAFVPGTIGIIGTWIGAALLVMGIAFLTLIARQVFIVVLILFAPIAILAWIFPGSTKGWKFWWETFTKLLLMYPMVMALIAAGRIFAFASGEAFDGLYETIIKLTAYVIPYAFIPFTFKAAGGLFGNLAGMVNDRSRGGFDRLRKRRQQGFARIGRNAKTGDMFRGATGGGINAMGRLNRGVARAATGPQGRFGFGERGSKARALNMATFGAEAAKDPRMAQFLVSDGDAATVMALSGGTAAGGRQAVQDLVDGQMQSWMRDNPAASDRQIRDQRRSTEERYERAYQSAAAMGFNNANATAALSNMGANKGYGLATGDISSLSRGVQRMGGGDSVQEALMGAAQYSLRGAGRLDTGGTLGDRSRETTNAAPDQRRALMDSIEKTGFNSEVALSPHATKQVQRTAIDDAARMSAGTLTPDEARQTAVMVSEAVTGLQYGATGEARDNIVDMIDQLGLGGVTVDSDPDVIQEAIANRFGFSTFGSPGYTPINFGNRKRTADRTSLPPGTSTGGTAAGTTSDRRMKKDIIYVGLTHSGIKLYRFRYLWSEVEYVGVMAQDVIHTHPEAVVTDKWGYYRVDYTKLGLEFKTYDDWKKESSAIMHLIK
jgi:hypothetical protein